MSGATEVEINLRLESHAIAHFCFKKIFEEEDHELLWTRSGGCMNLTLFGCFCEKGKQSCLHARSLHRRSGDASFAGDMGRLANEVGVA